MTTNEKPGGTRNYEPSQIQKIKAKKNRLDRPASASKRPAGTGGKKSRPSRQPKPKHKSNADNHRRAERGPTPARASWRGALAFGTACRGQGIQSLQSPLVTFRHVGRWKTGNGPAVTAIVERAFQAKSKTYIAKGPNPFRSPHAGELPGNFCPVTGKVAVNSLRRKANR